MADQCTAMGSIPREAFFASPVLGFVLVSGWFHAGGGVSVSRRRSLSVAVGRRRPPSCAVAFGGRSGLFFAHGVGLRA